MQSPERISPPLSPHEVEREHVTSPRRMQKPLAKQIDDTTNQLTQLALQEMNWSLEKCLNHPSFEQVESHLWRMRPKKRIEIKALLQELLEPKPIEPPPPAERATSPTAARTRASSISSLFNPFSVTNPRRDSESTLDKLQHLFSSKPKPKASNEPPRPLSPPPRLRRPTSPKHDEELDQPPHHSVSPRKFKSPPRMRKIPIVEEKEPTDTRPQSPKRTRLPDPLQLKLSDLNAQQVERARELLRLLSDMRVKQKDLDLLHGIERNRRLSPRDEPPIYLTDCLLLTNESIIPTEKLFQLLFTRLTEKRKVDLSQDRVRAMLDFCTRWVQVNRHTTLFAKGAKALTEIAEAMQIHDSFAVRKEASKLMQALNDVTIVSKKTVARSEESISGQMHFPDLMGHNKASPVKEYVEIISLDLLLYVKRLISQVKIWDFIKKWPTPPASLTAYTEFFNSFADFVADTILKEPDLQKRLSIVKFFLYIAEKSLQLGDLTSSASIFTGLNYAPIERLKVMKKLLEKDLCWKIYQELEEAFTNAKNFVHLRNLQYLLFDPTLVNTKPPKEPLPEIMRNMPALKNQKVAFFTPYMMLITKDLVGLEENVPKVIEREDELHFNYEKLLDITKRLLHIVSLDRRAIVEGHFPDSLQTNLLSLYFPKHMPLHEDSRYANATKFNEADALKVPEALNPVEPKQG